jgi:hypothetical protein
MNEINNQRERLRHSYKPEKIRILFIAESPPCGGTFFYKGDSVLYREIKKGFESHYGSIDNFLSWFKTNGFFLDDLVLTPVNDKAKKERNHFHTISANDLRSRIQQYKPIEIIGLLKDKSFQKAVSNAATQAGCNVKTFLPFPVMGHQKSFQKEFSQILQGISL